MWGDERRYAINSSLSPPVHCRCVHLRHPNPSSWQCAVPVGLELLLKLVDALVRNAETSAGFSSGDRFLSVETGTRQEHVETRTGLPGDEFDKLCYSVVEVQVRLPSDSRPQGIEAAE